MKNILRNYSNAMNRYRDYYGTSDRNQYWCFIFVATTVHLIVLSISLAFPSAFTTFLVIGVSLGYLFPTVAVCIRRLRDANFSPWFALAISPVVYFIPFGVLINIAAIVVFGCLPSAEYSQKEALDSPTVDPIDQLKKISALKESGVLDEAEFNTIKRKILAA